MSATPTAEVLIALAAQTLRRELLAGVAGADVIRALEIAGRMLADPGDEALWTLLDRVYDDGEGSAAQLARDIRSGDVDEESTTGLREALKRVLIAEVRVLDPDFLRARG